MKEVRVNCHAIAHHLSSSDGCPFSDSGFGSSELCYNRVKQPARSAEQLQSGGGIPDQQFDYQMSSRNTQISDLHTHLTNAESNVKRLETNRSIFIPR